ncbi:hypothetical protein [Amycolatopsis sp. H20-H5]|uniref:hypothetical protein n=1 Tax=Amycolatopsis sp. H20-H5 TaxID=3046309 RepID=UPI002DC02D86|nr:hypothetical protein [Amycolatopsis sp. H20-H5]MEC3981315.1 hypothetical protein [Amycolatopsis sp. H20-H5]
MTLFRGMLDDAAVFPPGLMALSAALPAHAAHLTSSYAEMVGPLVLAAPMLAKLRDNGGDTSESSEADWPEVSVTAPRGPEQVAEVVAARPPVRLRGFEVAVPAESSPAEFFAALERAGTGDVPVFVEVPRDERRPSIIAACAKAGYQVKFRTGGVKAELYPDEAELAAAVRAVVDAGVPFKATAGLHHALRNTDPETGFEQHGFLNLLNAVGAALDGADETELAAVLAERDAAAVAARVSTLDAAVRARFLSFGTCSIIEPLTELAALGLVPAAVLGGQGEDA